MIDKKITKIYRGNYVKFSVLHKRGKKEIPRQTFKSPGNWLLFTPFSVTGTVLI